MDSARPQLFPFYTLGTKHSAIRVPGKVVQRKLPTGGCVEISADVIRGENMEGEEKKVANVKEKERNGKERKRKEKEKKWEVKG